MNIMEIWDMTESEKAGLLHYLLGYAKSNEKFRHKFVESINERYDEVST